MLGVCYYPEHWPETWWEDDAAAMRASGITYVRIGEFAWSRIEPEANRFAWDWLDRVLDVLDQAKLRVVLGTPTATPPKWLVDAEPEILAVDREGRVQGFGARRHYSFSSPVYQDEAARITEALARRYGLHPAVAGWQTDNEYGCHDTVLSFDAAARAGFRTWLRRHYQDIQGLNEAWGNVFWSMEAPSFQAIDLPNLTPAEANPAAWLDFCRYSAERVALFNRRQVEIIRQHSPGRFITHNFMGFFFDFDHVAVAADLDFASWDSYPLGHAERALSAEDERVRWARTSHPDIAAFHHDLYRGIGHGRFWVMEQQPGPVNWAPWNPVPKPGMVRLWTWEALAHGAEVVSFFRWRQCPFAQEQMHAGLNRPDRQPSPGGLEAATVGRELDGLTLPATTSAEIALVIDYESAWITRIQPQGADFSYDELAFRWYEAIRRLGLDVDIVPAGASLVGYRAAVVPTLPHVSETAYPALRAFDGVLLLGPRSGSKDRTFRIPDALPPGPLQDLIPVKVTQVASLRPGLSVAVTGSGIGGHAVRWREDVESGLEPLASFAEGGGALWAHGRTVYLACWPDAALLDGVMRLVLGERAGLALNPVPDSVRLRRRGDLVFAFNYGDEPWQAPTTATVLGDPLVGPQDLAVWRP